MQHSIVILGGGAAGLAAAAAALRHARALGVAVCVTVLERQERVGKKILATGNGRCNLTNTHISPQNACLPYHSETPAAVHAVLAQVPCARVLGFFAQLGLVCEAQDEGRVYPHSNQASSVLDVLRAELARFTGAQRYAELCGFCAVRVLPEKGGFSVVSADGRRIRASRVLVCTGGLAAPQFGCDETGSALLRALGHGVTPVYPCLTPIKTDSPYPRALKGVKLRCTARLFAGSGAKAALLGEETGEVLLTEYGFSGIPVMQLSGLLGACGHSRGTFGTADAPVLALDLLPAQTPAETLGYLLARREVMREEALEHLLTGAVHKKAGHMLLKACGLYPLTRLCGTLTKDDCAALAAMLKHWCFAVTGTLPWSNAQVTGGGATLCEIDVHTMASRQCHGLYLCGEALDAAGACGGYNLHWAWATGILAGEAAAQSLLSDGGNALRQTGGNCIQ